jgi:ATP-binding cassette subfamily B protein
MSMPRVVGVWVECLSLSWRTAPLLTAGKFALELLRAAVGIGLALALRATVDAAARGSAGASVAAATAAAAACTVSLVAVGLAGSVNYRAVSRVGEGRLDPQLAYDMAVLEGVEHLERPEYLDRVSVLSGAAWGLVQGTWTAVQGVLSVLQIAATLVLLGSVSSWLLLLLVPAAVPLWCDRRGRRCVERAEIASAAAFRRQRALFELATSASAAKEIAVHGTAAELRRLQAQAWSEATGPRLRAQAAAAVWRLAGWAVFCAGFVLLLAAAMHTGGGRSASPGDIVLAVTVAATLQNAVGTAVGQATRSLDAGRLVHPYLWLREYGAGGDDRTERRSPPPELRRGISFDDVGYTYAGAAEPALSNITVDIPAGSVVAVVGTYGSGKSTLVKLLCKFYRPTSGTVRVDGVPLDALDTGRWRARTTAAFQDFGRYPQATLAESVGMGDLDAGPGRLAETLAEADAESLVERLPQGTRTVLGRAHGGVDLSEGQWQKVALARAAMREDPLLLLFDEPTASLDAPSEDAVYRRYMARARRLARRTGAVTFIVSHRFSTVGGADLVLVLDGGRLTEHGSHEALMARRGLYHAMYRLHADAYGE